MSYEANLLRALVLYNAVVAAAQLRRQNPVLHVGGQQLAPYVHSPQGRAVLALPGQDVEFVRGSIRPSQVGSHRASYINAILIQSRGMAMDYPCSSCRNAVRGPRPFTECRRVAGHFGGACANCKWKDHASRCSVRGDDGAAYGGPRRLDPRPDRDDGGDGSAARPLLIEDDDDRPGAAAHNAIVLA